MKIGYYELELGRKPTKEEIKYGTKNGSEISRGLVDAECSIAIKADHHPDFEEAEGFVKADLIVLGYDGIYGITPLSEDEIDLYFDTENLDNWKILGK